MTYQDLLDECKRDGIGSRFWNLLLEVARRVARRYPPEVYNNGEQWSMEAIHDLAQDVALERLIGENQLAYVLDLATEIDSLSRLLAFQVRRVLSHRRAITVVDRLLTRVRQLTSGPEYWLTDLGPDTFISFSDGDRELTELTAGELRRGALLIASIPRLASRPSAERESKVYSRRDLDELIRVLVRAFDGISLRDLRRILEITLTAWLPTVLRDHEEDHADESTPEFELQRSEMRTTINNFVADLDSDYRAILLGKAHGISDGDLASRLDRSRPWVAERKSEVLEMVESNVISQLPPELHAEGTRQLLDDLAALETPDD